jgi:hypothetical protein
MTRTRHRSDSTLRQKGQRVSLIACQFRDTVWQGDPEEIEGDRPGLSL